MTDRELLERAARAAGYWSAEFNCPDKLPHLGWNPLTDDGDALRLAVRLRISINQWSNGVSSTHAPTNREFPEDWGADPYAATRRAIVRAAAAMGGE